MNGVKFRVQQNDSSKFPLKSSYDGCRLNYFKANFWSSAIYWAARTTWTWRKLRTWWHVLETAQRKKSRCRNSYFLWSNLKLKLDLLVSYSPPVFIIWLYSNDDIQELWIDVWNEWFSPHNNRMHICADFWIWLKFLGHNKCYAGVQISHVSNTFDIVSHNSFDRIHSSTINILPSLGFASNGNIRRTVFLDIWRSSDATWKMNWRTCVSSHLSCFPLLMHNKFPYYLEHVWKTWVLSRNLKAQWSSFIDCSFDPLTSILIQALHRLNDSQNEAINIEWWK